MPGYLVQRYVRTGQGTQGITADPRAIVVYGTPSLVATRQEGFYVPCSRVRSELAVLTDSLAALRQAIQKEDKRRFASEIGEATEPQPGKPTLLQRLGKHLAFLRRAAAFARPRVARVPQVALAVHKEMGYVRG